MPSVEINWLAVLVAALINMVVGALWYSSAGFVKPWMKLTGHKMGGGSAGPGYAISAVGALLQAFILVHFVRYAGAITAVRGAEAGFWLWLGFVGVVMATNIVFEGRPWKLWAINAGYFLVVLIINGALLAAWR
ncbi:DUF1761 domain-containing protein [Candidatus Saccharibacteria bacterium]|nr:DUF1761 domain-containing protein [Candidatus Saccharibacteria bacterium]